MWMEDRGPLIAMSRSTHEYPSIAPSARKPSNNGTIRTGAETVSAQKNNTRIQENLSAEREIAARTAPARDSSS
jgi:hypothetical protein